MLKKFFALTGALTFLTGAAIAGESCCASKTAAAKSADTTKSTDAKSAATKTASAETKSCCAPKAKEASAEKGAACCAKDAKAATTKAAANKNVKATKVKLTDVRVCPMMGGKVEGKGAATQVVGKYNVHFCCGPCKPEFNKLSKADQQKKIREALKKQNAAVKTA